jgi:opacity protein-like surface antigen
VRHRFASTLAAALLLAASAGRSQERLTAIALTGSLTTESRLFYSNDSPDDLARAAYFPFGARFRPGIDLRRTFSDLRLTFGIAVAYLSASDEFAVPASAVSPGASSSLNVTVHDGYAVIPVELTSYFTLPLGADDIRLYIGGGLGGYLGRRQYTIGSAEAVNAERAPGFGIHILTGTEYDLSPLVAMRLEVKFRDAHFTSTDRFDRPSTLVNGVPVGIPSTPLVSRVSVDGMDLSLHLAYRF